MQALIDFLIRNLLQLWPIARVYTWQQGVRVRGGKLREELAPGLHWRWWFIDEVRTIAVTEMGVDLATATITTTDGVPVSISANVAYQSTSIVKQWQKVWDSQNTLRLIALGEIASRCALRSWEDLRSDRIGLELALLVGINERVAPWGMQIIRVHLTDLVISKSHRHYVEGMAKP